jgi:tRNA nucleotidyltransferase/poly(A) polymerase
MTDQFHKAEHAKVMHTLEHHGFEAFLVGGCVRDQLLRRQSKDFDVTTNATPDQVRAIFPKTIPVGAKFGVVVVVMDGVQIEVATYRADGAYTDGRRPDEVTYSETAKDDVVRRDFTMNGLLMDARGEITDYVGGRGDIDLGVIRAIGDPHKRFAEDALRMMRAVRFAAQLGFKIEVRTEEAIEGNARLLGVISRERIAMELFKILSAPFPLKGIVPFIATGLYRYALPQGFVDHVNMTRTIQRFGMFEANKDAMLGMAMLFADIDAHFCGDAVDPEADLKKPKRENLADYLKLSNGQKDELAYMKYHVLCFGQHLTGAYPLTEASLKRRLRQPGVELALEIMTQDEVMGKSSYGVEALMAFVLKVKAYTPEQIKPAPLATGKDLIDAGIPAGPIFTSILFDIESHQLNGVWTTKEQAMQFVRERTYQDTLKQWNYMGLSTAEVRELE